MLGVGFFRVLDPLSLTMHAMFVCDRSMTIAASKPGVLGMSIEIATSVPQERLGNNGATPSTTIEAEEVRTAPLERQTASFGSFDFLKLLETGPNGELFVSVMTRMCM